MPNDVVLERKIAVAYIALKNWTQAYQHFTRTPFLDLSADDRFSLLSALFLMDQMTSHHEELQKFPLSPEDHEYFSTLAECFSGGERCIEVLSSYTGSEPRLQELHEVVHTAPKVSTDTLYTLFLLATKLYEQKMYRLSGMFASEILSSNPNYHQVKKMR